MIDALVDRKLVLQTAMVVVQGMNKVSSAVQLRFDVANAESIDEQTKQRLYKIAANRISEDGILIIEAKNFRTQDQNKQEAQRRFTNLILLALKKTNPRKKTKPSRISQYRRVDEKRKKGYQKTLRKHVDYEDIDF